jgi:hypothetical protein
MENEGAAHSTSDATQAGESQAPIGRPRAGLGRHVRAAQPWAYIPWARRPIRFILKADWQAPVSITGSDGVQRRGPWMDAAAGLHGVAQPEVHRRP